MATSDTAGAPADKGGGSTRKRLARFCGLSLLLLAAPALLAVGAAGFAVGTRPGLQTLAWLAKRFGGDMVAIEAAEGALASGFTLRGLRYSGGGTALSLDEVRLDWQPTALLHKKLPVRDLAVRGLRLHLPASAENETAEQAAGPVKLPTISLPLAITAARAQLEDFHILSGEDEVFDLATAEVAGLEVQNENIAFDKLAAKNGWMDVTAKGRVAMRDDWPLSLELAYGFDFEGYGPIRGSGTVEGDFAKAVIKTATTEPQAVSLDGTATDILNDLHWQARATSPELALAAINGGWPELRFDAVAISGAGDIKSYDLDVSGNMRTPYTRRPLALAGQTQIGWEGLRVPALRLTDTAADGGHLDLVGSLDWSPLLAWDAVIELDKLNPDLAHAELPGALGGKIAAKGSLPESGVTAELALSGIGGELRGYPVRAEGELAYNGADGRLDLPGLTAAVGRNTLAVKGGLAEQYALDLRLDAPDLKELLPELDGNLRAEGQVRGGRAAPELNLELHGDGVAYGENRIGRLEGKASGVLSESGQLAAELRAGDIALGATAIDEIEAQLTGDMAAHTLRLAARAPEDQSVGLELAGGLKDGAWSGELRRTRLHHPLVGEWRQEAAAPLTASAQAAQLAPLCLRQEAAELCLNGGRQAENGQWQGAANIKNFPLAQFRNYLPPDLQLGGSLNLTATAAGGTAGLGEAVVNLATPGLRLDFLHGEAAGKNLVWQAHELAASYRGERLEAGWRHELTDGSRLDVHVEAPKLPLAGAEAMQAPLSGRLRLDFKNLDFLTALTRQRTRWSGAFRGDVAVSGSLGRPTLSGNLGLENGEVLAPELGLHLAPLSLAVGGEAGRITAAVSAHSERGELRATGGVDLSGEKPAILPLTVKGENFRVMNQPGLAVEISPDIRVDVGDEGLAVTGTVRIPLARVEDLSFDRTISPSSDVVVVEERKDEDKGGGLPLRLKLRLETGDEVLIDAYGLRARVGGHLDLTQDPGQQLSGNGQFNIERGSFSVYGKRVKINTGRLLFSGGAMTNPGIEIHSENTENNLTAGMRVSGFLKTPKVELYSRPFRQQSEIISHLIEDTSAIAGGSREDLGLIGDTAEMLGMGGLVPYLEGIKKLSMIDDIKLDTQDDAAALVFGSWVTPDFYVSYGKSLGGEESTFKTRYTLGHGFVVETESGETQSSGDIKYEFER